MWNLTVISVLGLLNPGLDEDRKSESWKEVAQPIINKLIADKKIHGMVIGVLGKDGKPVITSFGQKSENDKSPMDGLSIFEIGSITKTFNALLLADAVVEGSMKLNDPVRNHLPEGWQFPKRGEVEVTLEELATHTAGFHSLPATITSQILKRQIAGKPLEDPYASFSPEQLKGDLAKLNLGDKTSPNMVYNNFGAGLLGFVLCNKSGKHFHSLIQDRITSKLNMKDTGSELSEEQLKRFVPGHDDKNKVTGCWKFQDTMAGAGALTSTADDMLKYLDAQIHPEKTSITRAIELTHEPRKDAGPMGKIGLGWIINVKKSSDGKTPDEINFHWHNGGTGGFRTFCAFSKKHQVAVVVLCNSFCNEVDNLGRKLMAELSK